MGLDIADLSLRRGGRLVVSGLSFSVAPGGALLLRGPNGVGKSTLLRALAGLLPLAGGAARLDGVDRRADPEGFGERLAYAGHLDAAKAQLTLAENLGFWAGMFGAAPGAVAPALAAFGLAAIADRPAGACSAGQKRRLGLARLLLAPRRLWLLDEPTVSLDAETTATFAGLVAAHCAGGGMALIATHVDLGLPAAEALRLQPLRAGHAAAASDDPFLAGRM